MFYFKKIMQNFKNKVRIYWTILSFKKVRKTLLSKV